MNLVHRRTKVYRNVFSKLRQGTVHWAGDSDLHTSPSVKTKGGAVAAYSPTTGAFTISPTAPNGVVDVLPKFLKIQQ